MRTPRACGRGAARVGSGSALSSCGERATRSAVSVARNGRFLRKSIAVHVDDDRRPRVTLTRDLARVSALAPMFGRAFVTEPMMYWPMGTSGDVAARFAGCFASFLAVALPLGLVWEAGQADGVAVWVSPEQREAWDLHLWDQPQIPRRGRGRWSPLRGVLGVGRQARPRRAFLAAGHDRRRAGPSGPRDRESVDRGRTREGAGGRNRRVSLHRHPRNVAIYGRCGFRVYDEADAPDGGPRVWFMRWDP